MLQSLNFVQPEIALAMVLKYAAPEQKHFPSEVFSYAIV